MEARDYQAECDEKTFAAFGGGAKGVLNALPTGAGKTAVAGLMARRMNSLLFVVDREELAFQSQKTLQLMTGKQVHLECGPEYKAFKTAPNAKFVVAMSQSMIKRKAAYSPDRFEYIIEDECFPAGTFVDDRPIETIRIGDFVRSFNHETGLIELRKVVNTFRSKPSSIVRVIDDSGEFPACTASHPVFTADGYKPACELACDSIWRVCDVSKFADTMQLSGVPETDYRFSRNASEAPGIQSEEGQSLLFRGVHEAASFKAAFNEHGKNESKACKRKNDRTQSNAECRNKRAGLEVVEGTKDQESWRQWEWTDSSSIDVAQSDIGPINKCGHGTCCNNESSVSNAASLQTRHSDRKCDGMHRSGRKQSLSAGAKKAGQIEGSVLTKHRVDCVEVVEQTSDGTFGGVCSDGFVYNIEVEGNHNYFVNGFLVHNCHHSVSPTRTAIREYFAGKRGVIGFSATPTRADNKAAGLVYDTVAFQMSYLEAVDLGWLVPFKSRVVTCHDMDLRGFKGTAEYSTKELRKQIEKQAVIEHIARKTIAIADGRQTVLFARTVQQSQQICNLLKSMGERATHVDGKMMRYMRRDRLEQFSLKNFQFVCNCGLIEEGVDVPGIEVVSMAAPMRSTGRFMQRVGRGSRATVQLTGKTPEERRAQIAASDKPHFTVIDFIGQMDEHSAAMCFSGDLLAGDFDDETRKVAMRMATGQNEGDIRAIVANAREVVKHRRRKLSPQEERAAAKERYAKVERSREQVWAMKTTFHPFDVLELDRKLPDREISKADQYGRNLDYSERYLKDCHLTPQEINVLTNSQRVYLAKILRQRAETHAPWPQSRRIHACGYNAAELSKHEANELSNRITKAGFVRPSEDGPNQRYLAGQNGAPVSSSKDFIFL